MKMPFHKRFFITKWVNKLLPLNQRRFKKNLFTTPYYQSWCQHIENEEHFLTCNHQARQDHHKAFQVIISRGMKTHKIDPYLREIVQYYVGKLDIRKTNSIPIHYKCIHEKQLVLGPYSICYG